MEDIKVSVIIPVYNGEKYIEKSLLFLTKQTLREIEFICVNDASTDNSLNVLKAFKQVFPERFVIVNSEKNRGPGGARNIGLSYARGKYIAFMDSDDYADIYTYEEAYNEAELGDYDIVEFGYYDEKMTSKVMPLNIKGKTGRSEKVNLCNGILFIWNKLYKKTLIDAMQVKFRENTVLEDTDFVIEAYLRSESVSSIGKCFYNYTYREGSAARNQLINVGKLVNVYTELFRSIKNRTESLITDENMLKDCSLKACTGNLKSLLWFMFAGKNFSYNDYLVFDNTAGILDFKYYRYKSYTKDIRDIIFNTLEKDKEESFKKLIELKHKIQSGELDDENAASNEKQGR